MIKKQTILSAVLLLLVAGETRAATTIWQEVSTAEKSAIKSDSAIRYYQADDITLRNALSQVPHEISGDRSRQIRIPMPDGKVELFSVVESPIMAPGLAAKYPEIKTFSVIGVDNARATGRIDITPLGFHGMIDSAEGTVYIDPQNSSALGNVYTSRYKGIGSVNNFRCEVHGSHQRLVEELTPQFKTANRVSGNRIEYRLAVAATNEYLGKFGGNVTSAHTQIVVTINRVNAIYGRDHGIFLKLVDDNDRLYETVDNGLLSNGNNLALLDQVSSWIDSNLPNGNNDYDIGHIFHTFLSGSGGVARLGAVCDNAIKAGGVSGTSNPTQGDSFDIDLVAHEIGHQFNAEHTFNGTAGGCKDNRNPATAFEPGSGSTIMAYAGICPSNSPLPASPEPENLQANSDDTFHAGSISQINTFTTGAGNCYNPVLLPTFPLPGNSDPVLDAIVDKTIPANTPFVLDGSATDADPNLLEYQWDQMDAGCPTDAISFGTDNGSNALFRSYAPRAESWRNFPALDTQRQGLYDKAEVLPCQNRDLNFRLTVRDNNNGQDYADVKVSVDQASGPFEVTNLDPAPPIFSGTPFEVTWDIAGTDLPPISCMTVDFDLISFSPGYLRYTIHPLVATTSNLNDGSEFVTLNPDTATHPRSRVRVKCSDNFFYDLSDEDLNVTAGMNPPAILNDTALAAYSFENLFITSATAPVCGAILSCPLPTNGGPVTSGGANGDASAFGFIWMLLLAGLAVLRQGLRLLMADSES